MLKVIKVFVDKETHRKFKTLCAGKGKTMQEVLLQGIKKSVNVEEKSSSSGGFKAALQKQESDHVPSWATPRPIQVEEEWDDDPVTKHAKKIGLNL